MRVETREELERARLPKTLTFTVEDPLTHRSIYKVVMQRKEAQEAVEYLRTHNGKAPEFVHRFIDGMEIALSLRV